MFEATSTAERIRLVAPSVARGRLLEIDPDGTLIVTGENGGPARYSCDYLWVDRAASTPLVPGCQVLFVAPQDDNDRGCVMGVVGRYVKGTSTDERPAQPDIADSQTIHERTIEIAADEKLTLKCGESSIVLAGDGTIIIHGTRLISRARGVNRIKGASVQIN